MFLVRCGVWTGCVGHFEKYLYWFIQLSHFVNGICFAEVEHKISQWNGVGINVYSVNCFLMHVVIWYMRISHIAERLPQHCEYRNTYTLSKWMNNVSIMLWRCFLTTFCGTIAAIFLKFPGICCSNLTCQRFHNSPPPPPQRCGNVAATIYC